MIHLISFSLGVLIFVGHARAETLVIKLGEEKRLSLPKNNRVWVQNRKVLAVNVQGGSLSLHGKTEGNSNLQVGTTTYQVQVIQPLKQTLLKAFEKELPQMLGLQLKMRHHQVQVSGKLYRWEDWKRLAEISEDLQVPYAMTAEIPTSVQIKAQQLWQERFRQEGLALVPVHFAKPLQAKLSVDAATFSKYETILNPYGVVLEKDAQALDVAPVVKVQITVAEVRRSFSMKYGLKWPDQFQAQILADGHKEFENLVFSAQALEENGQGKILASPNLLCRSGKEAEFFAGGEFPIKILHYKSQGVVWKKYGIILKVRPKADASGRLSIALETEVSTLDHSQVVEGIPGLLTNRISSHFDLSKSQTIALSGLIKNEDGKSSEGLPLLSRLPILGSLFSSRDFRENRTELVLFVRPSILNEQSPEDRASINQHLGALSHD